MEIPSNNGNGRQNPHSPKIVHFTTGHRAFDVRIFHKECSSLSKAGYEVVLVVPHERDQMAGQVRVKALPVKKSRLYRFTVCAWRACREALPEDAAVYHFHDPELVPVGIFLRALRKKVIYDVHDDLPGTFTDKEYIPKWLRQPTMKLARMLEDAAAAQFSAIVAATPAIGERFTRSNPKTIVIQNFVLPDDLTSTKQVPWSEREPTVAFVGGMSPERGIRELVQAMSLLPDSVPARLALAGWFSPGPLRGELEGMPGWARVNDIGLLDRRAVASLLTKVCAGVVTFLPRPNHVRAGPNKMFEYMSAGIPVIASDFPLWREIIERAGCGLLVDPEDTAQIAAAIEYLLTHPDEANAMGRRGRAEVERLYCWHTEELKLLQLYQSLVQSPVQSLQAGIPSEVSS